MSTLNRLYGTDVAKALQKAHHSSLITAEDKAIFFVDTDILDERLDHLRNVFPKGTLHAIPVKTHPLIGTLAHIAQRGFGAEAASLEELFLAKAAGFSSDKLVWDSPVKTKEEINICLREFQGAYVNANSLEELDRFPESHNLKLGLRINPMKNSGAPDVFDVSSIRSKFGQPITDRQEIVETYLKREDLTGIHIHSGSGLGDLIKNVDLLEDIADIYHEINLKRSERGIPQLSFFDIGGGATTPMDESPIPSLEGYAREIHRRLGLNSNTQLVTEFGRYTYAHCSWLWSRIESHRHFSADQGLIYIHVGADGFLREAYMSNGVHHRMDVIDRYGGLKPNEGAQYDIAGPLCFAGDYIDKNVSLAHIQHGDQLVIHDVGANTFALWSRHCSRRSPKVISYSRKSGKMKVIREKENLEDIMRFWGGT